MCLQVCFAWLTDTVPIDAGIDTVTNFEHVKTYLEVKYLNHEVQAGYKELHQVLHNIVNTYRTFRWSVGPIGFTREKHFSKITKLFHQSHFPKKII